MEESGIDIKNNYVDTTPIKDNHEFYNFAMDCEDDNIYKKETFLSEAGFLSEPSFVDYKEDLI